MSLHSDCTRKLLMAGASVAILMSLASAGRAQDAVPAQEPAREDVTEVIVTGVSKGTNKLSTSISVSSVQIDELQKFAPRSTAEVFRNIPGVRSESTGGEGNANIAVRGLPVAAGGAKFLQLQEDGLPVLEFGDIAFGNADIFLRTDLTAGRIEAIRGGTASTLASNSPGGIINVISKDGSRPGGTLQLTQGVDFGQTRGDFEFGGPLTEAIDFHVGGFYRSGEGPRTAGYTANQGGQIKANLTRKFDNGFIRVGVKYLNDKSIGYLPMPMKVTGTNSDPTWSSAPGLDARADTIHSAYFLQDAGLDGRNNRSVTDIRDGMAPKSLVFNGAASFDLGNGWALNGKFRVADTEANFASLFPAQVGSDAAIVSAINGAKGTSGTRLVVASGPGAGTTYTGLAMIVHTFNTRLNSLDNAASDLKLSKTFDAGDVPVDMTFGLYNSSQTIDMDWIWNSYAMEVAGDNARPLNLYNGNTNLSQNGLYAYGVPLWGNCCTRHYDVQYDIVAPYVMVNAQFGKLTVEGSVRQDSGKARGNFAYSTQMASFDVNGDGTIQNPETSVSFINYAAPKPVNYDWNYTSYSLGANYRLSSNLSYFGRYSNGARANADRLLFGKINETDGSVAKEDAVDFVKQLEVGVKYRNGSTSLFVTAFAAETEEQNFEATSQKFFDRVYKASGIELEGAYRNGNFHVSGGATYTRAEISKDALNAAQVGNRPRRQAEWVFQVTPSYNFDRLEVGANFVGTTDAYAQDDNQLVMPGYIQTNLFADYDLTEALTASLNINNAFDVLGITEVEEGAITANATNYVRARAINGRTTTVTLKYRF
ncbi:TonB-dependent receptor domain-containing protein [Asticcacaulis sp. AC402]|uniref:TonB-dependent receptor domain-containing protein n=1 Tax=Asticcacaulis sp. AC402 TaxID=1282361 RepID=UPI0004CE193C|nr:TonB-dependent receptor [Asticcacaulis sp. AC402]